MPAVVDVPAIEIEGLTKRFGDLTAVDGASFAVPRGVVFGFLGPNGSGKTTTLGMLTGLLLPDEGTARISGCDVADDLPGAMAHVGALIEDPAFYPHLSGRRNLRLLAPLVGKDAADADAVLARMGLAERGDARYGIYSMGMRRRLGLAAALLADPQVLILDEPTNGLDPAGQLEVRTLLRALAAEGRTILLSSHQLAEVQAICSHVAIIHHGRIIRAGPMGDVLRPKAIVDVEVDDAARAAALLAPLRVEQEGDVLHVHAPIAKAAEINRRLVNHGIAVRGLVARSEVLEQRFLELTADGAGGPAANPSMQAPQGGRS